MTPLILTLALSSAVSLFTPAETTDSPICYRKEYVDDRTTNFIRTSCVVGGDKQSDVKLFESVAEFSLTALYKLLEDSENQDDTRELALTSNKRNTQTPCVSKDEVDTSGLNSVTTFTQQSGSSSESASEYFLEVAEQSPSSPASDFVGNLNFSVTTFTQQSGSSSESASECFLEVAEQSPSSPASDFVGNLNFSGQNDLQDSHAFTFIDVYCLDTDVRQIYIGAKYNIGSSVGGKIFFPSQSVSDNYFVLGPGEGRFFQIPASYQRPNEDDSGLLLNKTVVVAANESIVVYAYQGCAGQFGKQASAFRVEEIKNLGTEYWVLTYFGGTDALLGIVAVEENTSVIISFNHTNGKFEMDEQAIVLNKYDTFYVVLPFDATGTYITSNRKLSVIVGVKSIELPPETRRTEPFCETLTPVTNWGRSFSVAHFLGPDESNDYIVKFMSAVNNNTVHWQQGPYKNQTILQQGQSKELFVKANVTDVLEINSSKHILVAQFATKGSPGFTNPAMAFIPAHDGGIEEEVLVPIFDISYIVNATNYLTVWVSPTEQPLHHSLESLCTVDWRELKGHGSGWKIFLRSLKAGSHILRINKGRKVRAMVFASTDLRSFAYPVE